MDIQNRYFTKYDPEQKKLGSYSCNTWNDKFEYKFAIDNIDKNDEILIIEDDNLAKYAEKKVKKCINTSCCRHQHNIKFNKIFCISKLNQLKMSEQERLFIDMKSLLKMSGKIIFTDVHPAMNINRFLRLVKENGLHFEGESYYDKTVKDILRGNSIGEKCYKAVLVKHVKHIELDEIKPEFPMEYKSKTL